MDTAPTLSQEPTARQRDDLTPCRWYRNGALDGSVAGTDSLSQLTDVNNWLGRSQYLGDPDLRGTLYEFRIYNTALSQAAIQASFMAGTDPLFLN